MPRRKTRSSRKNKPRPPWWAIPPEKQEAFLELLCNGERHLIALKATGMTWRAVSTCLAHDAAFQREYAAAQRIGLEFRDIMRVEAADERAINGWLEPVYQQGVEVGAIHRFSDRLMELRLKAADPKKYVDRHEYSGPEGGPIPWANIPPAPRSMEEWEEEARAAMERRGRGQDHDGET